MTLLQCARCIAMHGAPGCPATLEDFDGKPVCAWCTDLEPCPVEQKRLRAAKKKPGDESPPKSSAENSSKRANERKIEAGDMKSTVTDPISTPKKISDPGSDVRRCRRPGCENKLSVANVVGLCARHVRWTAPSNGHAHAVGNGTGEKANSKSNGSNGHAPKNGNGHTGFLEDRIDKLILSLPVSDKVKILDSWTRGQL